MIIRIKKRDRFAIIDKKTLEDSSLTFKATGLLVYLLSKPDNWQVSMQQLSRAKKDGMISVRSSMKELVTARYVVREKLKDDETKQWRWIYVVSEYPQ